MEYYGDGISGEMQAKAYLESKGYRILDQRKAYKNIGELDIVAMDGETLVFVEVKTRNQTKYGDALESFTVSKMQKVVKAAKAYLREYHGSLKYQKIRFDVIAIQYNNIKHIENAFYDNWY